jgi:methylphosphotriester-DNA--protein-cysteine methyltransferase
MPGRKSEKRGADLTDTEVQAILVQSMADAGYDPAFVYAFRKTGVYICEENANRLPKNSLKAFDAAVNEYVALIGGPAH